MSGLLVRALGNPTSPTFHVELGLGSPLVALGRYSTDLSLLNIMSSDRITLFVHEPQSVKTSLIDEVV